MRSLTSRWIAYWTRLKRFDRGHDWRSSGSSPPRAARRPLRPVFRSRRSGACSEKKLPTKMPRTYRTSSGEPSLREHPGSRLSVVSWEASFPWRAGRPAADSVSSPRRSRQSRKTRSAEFIIAPPTMLASSPGLDCERQADDEPCRSARWASPVRADSRTTPSGGGVPQAGRPRPSRRVNRVMP